MSERLAELEAENALLKQRVNELSQAEKVLLETEERYALAMQGANEGLWDWDPVSKELYLSARLLRTLGMGRDTLKTTSDEWLAWVHEADRDHYQKVLCRHLKGETEYFRCEYRVRNSTGGYVWTLAHGMALRNEENIAYRMVGSIGDITEQKEYQEKLLYQATYDHLTGLPNRTLALDRLSVAISRSRRNNTSVGLLFVDLDNFKKINDTLGHDIGDRYLKEISTRLTYCFRDGDTIARLGGDEFLVILPDLESIKQVEEFCLRILAVVVQPVTINGYELAASASIGVTLYPEDGYEPGGLLRNADTAMYQAKAQGKDTFCFYTPEMDQESVRKFTMESYLRRALSNDQFCLHYQSIISSASGEVVGAEALLRWFCPEYGYVPPDQFIPLAEESGLIVAIGDWVLEVACRQAADWRNAGFSTFKIAVNVSYPQFRDGHIVSSVENALAKSGLPANCLELELTERLLMEEERGCAEALNQLSAMGVQLSIDDFGTGFSSLSYLQRFPVNTLKIDRSFIAKLQSSAESPALVLAIIRMAQALGIEVVGEGVEDEQQLNFLAMHGCEYVQGYLLAKPVIPEEFCLAKQLSR